LATFKVDVAARNGKQVNGRSKDSSSPEISGVEEVTLVYEVQREGQAPVQVLRPILPVELRIFIKIGGSGKGLPAVSELRRRIRVLRNQKSHDREAAKSSSVLC